MKESSVIIDYLYQGMQNWRKTGSVSVKSFLPKAVLEKMAEKVKQSVSADGFVPQDLGMPALRKGKQVNCLHELSGIRIGDPCPDAQSLPDVSFEQWSTRFLHLDEDMAWSVFNPEWETYAGPDFVYPLEKEVKALTKEIKAALVDMAALSTEDLNLGEASLTPAQVQDAALYILDMKREPAENAALIEDLKRGKGSFMSGNLLENFLYEELCDDFEEMPILESRANEIRKGLKVVAFAEAFGRGNASSHPFLNQCQVKFLEEYESMSFSPCLACHSRLELRRTLAASGDSFPAIALQILDATTDDLAHDTLRVQKTIETIERMTDDLLSVMKARVPKEASPEEAPSSGM